MNKFLDAFLTLRGILKFECFLKYSQNYSKQKAKLVQENWLSKLLVHCEENIPWYRDRFKKYKVNVNSSSPFDELKKLPILSKKEFHKNKDLIMQSKAGDSLKFHTSGTSGNPITTYTSKNQWIYEQGIIWRSWKWAGYKFRDKIAIFRSFSPNKGESLIKKDYLKNWTYFSVFDMSEENMDYYFKYLRKWKPAYLRGYPSALRLIALHAINKDIKLPSLKGAFSASETIPNDLRQLLLKAFNIQLFDHYGQAEITCMFHNREDCDNLYLDWEYGYVELAPKDNRGDAFKIIATNFHNFSMPLLRYDTGDLSNGGWIDSKSDKMIMKIDSIRGREDDYLTASDGSMLSTVNLYTYFSIQKDIKQFQLIHERPGHLNILINFFNKIPYVNRENICNKVKNELINKTKFEINIKMTDEFIKSDEGKMPAFIKKLKNDL